MKTNEEITNRIRSKQNPIPHFVDLSREERIALMYDCIMDQLGIKRDEDSEHTPARVAKSLLEMTQNEYYTTRELDKQMTSFPTGKIKKLVKIEDIEFSSICAHHHLPFTGKVSIKYIPGESILGLSKFARIVEWFSKKTQTQENLTEEIARYIVDTLDPDYLAVAVKDSIHTCMLSRGVKSSAKTSTFIEYAEGEFKSE